MVARMLGALVIFHFIFISSECCTRRNQEEKRGLSFYVYPNNTLPADLQVTAFLPKGKIKRFFYPSYTDRGSLSLTLTTCTSPILWSFSTDNTTAPFILTQTTTTRFFPPSKSTFSFNLIAETNDTFVFIYISTEPGGPTTLQTTKYSNVHVLKRHKGKRLTVKWNPSLVDPQGTSYCVFISPTPIITTFCEAKLYSRQNSTLTCVGRKTHHTLTNLKHNQKYYFQVFAINHQSNFTYSYGTTSAVFYGRFRHFSLKDSKTNFADLKELDGKAVFKYKVKDNSTTVLNLFILPCGGAIDVEVTLKDKVVIQPKRVGSFEKIIIENPIPLARYYIKIFALNREELKKSSGVQIYAATKPTKVPLPTMPQILKLREYKSMSTCNSVTVAWMVAPGEKNIYCLTAKQGKIRETEEYRVTNQCGLEHRLRKSTDFKVKYCSDFSFEKESVAVQKLTKLKPNRFYIIQVTVSKPKGKTLSYDLLQVRTKPSCKKKN